MDPERIDFVPDVLANIRTRLPPNTSRRLRLVCRHWRDVVGTRTATNLLSRAKTLVAGTGCAYIIDNLPAPGKPRALWAEVVTEHLYGAMSVVGTCNGLVCLCDDREIGGAVTVANPATHEALSLPPLPPPRAGGDQSTCRDRGWHVAYGFAYLPTSMTRCSYTSWTVDTTEVWVMEGATGQIRWSRWYVVQMTNPRRRSRPGTPPSSWFQRLAWPLLLHGERILAWQTEWPMQRGCVLCMHAPIYDTMRAKRGVVNVSETNRGMVVTSTGMDEDCRTFAYLETE